MPPALSIPFRFHHLGLATKNLDRSAAALEAMGYQLTDAIHVPAQDVIVRFGTQEGHPTIELIAPASDTSPVRAILAKVGSGPYHLCYSVPGLAEAQRILWDLKFRPVGEPFVSNAIRDQKTCFFYHNHVGLIEVSEER